MASIIPDDKASPESRKTLGANTAYFISGSESALFNCGIKLIKVV